MTTVSSSVPQRGAEFCHSCGASIPHRIGEGRCPDCMEHLPQSTPQKGVEEKPKLICPKCGADRYAEACKLLGVPTECPMHGVPQSQSAPQKGKYI